ncbi:MAG: aldehyde dehydrogenase family protein [Psychromonas sp.]
MKISIQSMVDKSLDAWANWQDLGFEARAEIIQNWAKQLDKDAQAMVNFQCENALQQVSQTIVMPGPTGESNELSCAGRGAFVISAEESSDLTAIAGQISAVLVTGNTVFICLPETSKFSAITLKNQLQTAGCPEGVVEAIDYKELNGIISHTSVAGIAYAGNAENTQILARTLAARDGLLAQLIAETDPQLLPVVSSPTYAFRFITERTCTINITAVGGNAMLLELGSGEH